MEHSTKYKKYARKVNTESNAGLLVRRNNIDFKFVEGDVIKYDSDTSIFPVVSTRSVLNADTIGIRCGQRSGIITVSDTAYKIKGCGIEIALMSKKRYTMTHQKLSPIPEGGLSYKHAERELEVLNIYNELMREEGFAICSTPAAIIHYNKEFSAGLFYRIVCKIPAIRELSGLDSTGLSILSSAVTKIKGDTRIPELYHLVKDSKLAKEVMYKLGLMIGSQKKIMGKQIYIGTGNSHVGNIVVFVSENSVHANWTDFDSSKYHSKYADINHYTLETETNRLMYSTRINGEDLVHGTKSFEVVPADITASLRLGIEEGNANPRLRNPIPLDEMCSAFDIMLNSNG